MSGVCAVNLARKQAMLECGTIVPVVAMFDGSGMVTTNPAHAESFDAVHGHEHYNETVADYQATRQ